MLVDVEPYNTTAVVLSVARLGGELREITHPLITLRTHGYKGYLFKITKENEKVGLKRVSERTKGTKKEVVK